MSLKFKAILFILFSISMLGIGVIIGSKYCPAVFNQIQEPFIKPKKKTHRVIPQADGLAPIVEDVVEDIAKPKPLYKLTLIPSWDFQDHKIYYALLYEKKYDLPFLGETYLGVFANNNSQLGVSISKDLY